MFSAKYLYLSVGVVIFSVCGLSQKALAKECPFDSYMLIGGKCHDLGLSEPKVNVHPSVYQTYDYEENGRESITVEHKTMTCSDFKYQESAQDYLERNPDNRTLDNDGDGYACEHLTRISREILTTSIWNELLSENIAPERSQ